MRSHLALTVRDVPRSVAFYTRVFGVPPQKTTATYAKFDLHSPSLNFSLVAGATPSRVSHLGIEAEDAAEFTTLRARLAAAGVPMQEEAGSRCCHALQDKVWFRDPDDNAWEVFLVHAQLPITPAQAASTDACCAEPATPAPPTATTAAAARQTPTRGGCCG